MGLRSLEMYGATQLAGPSMIARDVARPSAGRAALPRLRQCCP